MGTEAFILRLRREALLRVQGQLNRKQMSILSAHFDWSVGRVLKKQGSKDFNAIASMDDIADKTAHIVDWILASLFAQADWLKVRDEKQRPRKLMKCGTLEALCKEADKWVRIQNNKPKIVDLDVKAEQLFMDLGNGWRMVRMRTSDALDKEGQAMNICIGSGAYDWYLRGNDRLLLSLRDIRNEPHVTVDLDMRTNSMIQIRGKNNGVPNQEYLDVMKPFFKHHGHVSGDMACGLLFGFEGEAYFIDAVPEGAVLRSICRAPNGSSYLDRLPNGVKAIGKHDLTGISLTSFFNGRHLGVQFIGDTDISYSTLPSLIPRLHPFRGNLKINDATFNSFERGFELDGSLRIEACKHFTTLPPSFHIGGDLLIFDCALGKIPDDLQVDGDVLISGCGVRKIPSTAEIGGKTKVLW